MENVVNRSLSLQQVKAVLDVIVDVLAGGVEQSTLDGVTEMLIMLDIQLENQLAQ